MDSPPWYGNLRYEVESNENLKYVLSRNLLNTKSTQWLHFSRQCRTATCRPLFKPSASLLKVTRQSSCVSRFYRNFKVFIWLSLVYCRAQNGPELIAIINAASIFLPHFNYISFKYYLAGGKQWQTTPKYLPRMQCARAIPVTWLGSGSCQPGL